MAPLISKFSYVNHTSTGGGKLKITSRLLATSRDRSPINQRSPTCQALSVLAAILRQCLHSNKKSVRYSQDDCFEIDLVGRISTKRMKEKMAFLDTLRRTH